MAKAIRETVPIEIFPLLEVVARVVRCHPMRDRIHVQVYFLGALRFANEHLARWNEAVDQVQLSVVEMKRFVVNVPVFGKLDFTFWQVLGSLNSGNFLQSSDADPGIFGLLAILALAGPFLHSLWKDPRALLGGFLPLGFMLVIAWRIFSTSHSAFPAQATGPYEQFANLHHGILSLLTVGFGTYLSASLATCLALLNARQFLGFGQRQSMEGSLKVAA